MKHHRLGRTEMTMGHQLRDLDRLAPSHTCLAVNWLFLTNGLALKKYVGFFLGGKMMGSSLFGLFVLLCRLAGERLALVVTLAARVLPAVQAGACGFFLRIPFFFCFFLVCGARAGRT